MIIGILFNDDYICTLKVIIHLLFRNFINYEGKSVVTELFFLLSDVNADLTDFLLNNPTS